MILTVFLIFALLSTLGFKMFYPTGFDFAASYNEFAYANLDPEILAYISDLWLDLKLQ